MGRKVPVKYLDLGENGMVVLQNYFWVIKPAGREKRIYSIDNHLMIFSSKEKALMLLGISIPEHSIIDVMFWEEIVCFNYNFKKAVLDYNRSANKPRIQINLDSEREGFVKRA